MICRSRILSTLNDMATITVYCLRAVDSFSRVAISVLLVSIGCHQPGERHRRNSFSQPLARRSSRRGDKPQPRRDGKIYRLPKHCHIARRQLYGIAFFFRSWMSKQPDICLLFPRSRQDLDFFDGDQRAMVVETCSYITVIFI